MPPAKGDLHAIKAILGLFVIEPGTPDNVKARLRREYPHAAWSRGIVYTSVASLLRKREIERVHEGFKPSQHFYRATDLGVREFKRWMVESSHAPAPLRDSFLLWIAHSTERDLPLLLSIARMQEEGALVEEAEAQRRLNAARRLGDLGPADGSDWNGRVHYTVLSHAVKAWNCRAQLAKSIRLNLTQGTDMHEAIPVEEADDV
jgi:DNA-binding PadR family transcriptional regulator